MAKYSDKLKDPRWQKVRLKVMERDSFTCRGCGGTKKTLHVHHLAYHGDPWGTPEDLLETLCEKCHTQREDLNNKFKQIGTFHALNYLSEIIDLGEDVHRQLDLVGTLIKRIRELNAHIKKAGPYTKGTEPLHKERDRAVGILFSSVYSAIGGE